VFPALHTHFLLPDASSAGDAWLKPRTVGTLRPPIVMMMMMIIIIIIIITDRTIPNNKPDIVIRDNKKETCMLTDVAIPGDRNVIQKESEKILKYRVTIKEIDTFNIM
jgi:hypothetical protein